MDSNKPTVLILGTFHMGPNQDLFNNEMDDLLTPRRQQEIREVVDRIKRFNPTKLAVEEVTKNQSRLSRAYRQYLTGHFELELNEIHQVGFRIAAELNHKTIYAIDWMEGGARTRGAGEVYEWAKAHQPDLFTSIFGWLETEYKNQNPTSTILDLYQNCNDPELIKKDHQMYINMARIGEIDNYVGMGWLIWWYQRNLILFSNLSRIATSSDDRILLLIGRAHVQILYQFLNESGLFQLESAENYLVQ